MYRYENTLIILGVPGVASRVEGIVMEGSLPQERESLSRSCGKLSLTTENSFHPTSPIT